MTIMLFRLQMQPELLYQLKKAAFLTRPFLIAILYLLQHVAKIKT